MMTAKLSKVIEKENMGKDLTFSKGAIKYNSFKTMSDVIATKIAKENQEFYSKFKKRRHNHGNNN